MTASVTQADLPGIRNQRWYDGQIQTYQHVYNGTTSVLSFGGYYTQKPAQFADTQKGHLSSTSRAYFVHDYQGSVRGVSAAYGNELMRIDYDAFGQTIDGYVQNFGYTGKPVDQQSKQYNYGYRHYAPQQARFTSVDPIKDGSNWYAYVGNDPVNFVDPLGLSAGTENDETPGGLNQDLLEEYGPDAAATQYFNQSDWTDDFGVDFAASSCAATACLNEVSEEYTEETNQPMTKDMATDAMQAAIDNNSIDSTDGYVNNWETAATSMAESVGLEATASYNENGEHIIYAEDPDQNTEPDHFTNSADEGEYHDPWNGEVGIVGDTPLQAGRETRGFDFDY